jgi:hypothetical protein
MHFCRIKIRKIYSGLLFQKYGMKQEEKGREGKRYGKI